MERLESINRLKPAERMQVANYLAYVHVTGQQARRLHTGTNWSTDVLLGSTFDSNYKLVVHSELLPLIANHPFVVNAARFKAQGFRIDFSNMGYKWSTVRKGIPMVNPDTGQKIWLESDGKVHQSVAPGGKYVYVADLLAGAAQ